MDGWTVCIIFRNCDVWKHTRELDRHQPEKCDFYIDLIWMYFSDLLSHSYDQVIKNCLLQQETLLVLIKCARAHLRARKLHLISIIKLHF